MCSRSLKEIFHVMSRHNPLILTYIFRTMIFLMHNKPVRKKTHTFLCMVICSIYLFIDFYLRTKRNPYLGLCSSYLPDYILKLWLHFYFYKYLFFRISRKINIKPSAVKVKSSQFRKCEGILNFIYFDRKEITHDNDLHYSFMQKVTFDKWIDFQARAKNKYEQFLTRLSC